MTNILVNLIKIIVKTTKLLGITTQLGVIPNNYKESQGDKNATN